MPDNDLELNRRLYHALLRIRRLEEEVARIYPTDKVKSPVHLSIGQEFISVAICEALEPRDVVFGTCRGHALYLAKGGDMKRMVAELFGKSGGCARGKGGSMHLVDVDAGVMGTPAIVASSIPHAVGHALAMRQQKQDRITVSFLGDGSVEEGVFHESVNFAALKKLPILFVCENNEYAIHTHIKARQSASSPSDQARSYGLTTESINNGDLLTIRDRAINMVQRLRSGEEGPFFLECRAARWKEHVGPGEDWDLGFRDASDIDDWVKNDQVTRFADLLPANERAEVEARVDAELKEAFAFAEESPFPGPEELHDHLFQG